MDITLYSQHKQSKKLRDSHQVSYRIKQLALLFPTFSFIEILALQVISQASHSRLGTPFNLGSAVTYLWGWPFSRVDSDPFPLSCGSSYEGFLLTLTDVSLDKNLFEGKSAATTINLQERENSESAQLQMLQKQRWEGNVAPAPLPLPPSPFPSPSLPLPLPLPPPPSLSRRVLTPGGAHWVPFTSMDSCHPYVTSKTLLCICSDVNMHTFSLIYLFLNVFSK